MSNETGKVSYDPSVGQRLKDTQPTPNEMKWARERFSSRAEPPKT